MKTVIFAIALGLLAGCAHGRGDGGGSALTAVDFYPLALGNRWTYELEAAGRPVETKAIEIVGRDGDWFIDNTGAKLQADPYGVRDEKRYLLRDPIKMGSGWNNVVSVSSAEHYRIVSTNERCTVPAGSFADCVTVEARNRVDEKSTFVIRWTYAPHVGMVQFSTTAEIADRRVPQLHVVLKAFSLTGKQS